MIRKGKFKVTIIQKRFVFQPEIRKDFDFNLNYDDEEYIPRASTGRYLENTLLFEEVKKRLDMSGELFSKVIGIYPLTDFEEIKE